MSRPRAGIPAAVLSAVLAGCARSGVPSAVHSSLVIAQVEEPRSLNPLLSSGYVSGELNGLVFSYLTTYDTKGGIIPQVARVVPTTANGGISRDGLEITYHLRRDVRWQDGVPLTARDVVYTYDAIVNPRSNAVSRFGYEGIRSVKALGPYTVRVSLKKPLAAIVPFFFGGDSNYPILPAHVPLNSRPVGSGPYRLVDWQRGDRMTFAANPRYFLGKPAIARIVVKFVPNEQTITNELRTGEVDTEFDADLSQVEELRTLPDHHLVQTPMTAFGALLVNTSDPVMHDPRVRRALAMSVDRKALVRKVLKGIGNPDTGMRGLFTWAYDPSAGNIPYDPAGARKLLRSTGNARPLRLAFLVESGAAWRDAMATQIAAYAAGAGIQLSIREVTPDLMNAPDGPFHQGRYQVALMPIESTDDPGASWLLGCDQFPPNGFNDMRYCDPRIQRLLDRGATSADRTRRARDYARVQHLLMQDLPIIFLYQTTEIDVVPDWLQNYRPSMYTGQFTFAYQWRTRAPAR